MKRCHGRLHYDRKFQIFIFLIGYINVNKGVFLLRISYLRIKGYNVLNYNNCSTDWSFPLRTGLFKLWPSTAPLFKVVAFIVTKSYDVDFNIIMKLSDVALNNLVCQ